MKIIKTTNKSAQEIIDQAVEQLNKGNLVIYPTETCYGIAADATNSNAIQKLLAYKGFRKGKPISVAVADKKMAAEYVEINQTAENLYDNFLPGPLTVVSQGKHRVVDKLESERGTLGIRIPDHELTLDIIKNFAGPITSTSANISNKKTPYTINDVLETLTPQKKELLSLIIDAGKLEKRPPSTVVETTLDKLQIIREGRIDFSELNYTEETTNRPEQTQNLAENLIEQNFNLVKNGYCLVFALQGKLGAGKTQFCKGIGNALNIRRRIKSPTYTLVREHQYKKDDCKGVFFHIDTWRMENPEEIKALGMKKMFKSNNIIAIEWVEKAKQLLEDISQRVDTKIKIFWIEINYTEKKQQRNFKVASSEK
jgi:L-threonylcarbamoyladenylate synthase